MNIKHFCKKRHFRYVEAKELEIELLGFLGNNKFTEAYECAFKAREMLTSMPEERREKVANLPVFLRRFSAFWVLTRCVSHGAGVLERQKKYAVAISWQRFLLKTPAWSIWIVVPLIIDATFSNGNEEALQEIREGMEDDAVADKDKLMLQDRALRISNRDFLERIVLTEPIKRSMEERYLRTLEDSRNKYDSFEIDVPNNHLELSVPRGVVTKHYLDKEVLIMGCRACVHAEGSIWHTVLGLLFYDIIFDHNVNGVWLSEVQTNPIDLNSRDLFESRRERFEERFSWLQMATDEEIADAVRITWIATRHCGRTSEINWVFSRTKFLFCCPRSGLLAVLRRIVTDYRNCRSGFPDLTVVEVKGPGDRLSTKQRLWLDFFMRNEIRAEVCHVIARSDRELR
ncbi:VRR-NUC domain protein [Cooperia oncophora]